MLNLFKDLVAYGVLITFTLLVVSLVRLCWKELMVVALSVMSLVALMWAFRRITE